MVAEKVEIGFDLEIPGGPYFTLDDPVKGKLDNTTYTLAGFQYYDITNYVKGIQLNRGKSDNISSISAGDFVVELNNRTRVFDPTYEASPFYGQIIPKRSVKYSINNVPAFQGVIDDWGLSYTADGDAVANFVASDGFVYLSNQTLAAGTATAQLSGARVEAILDNEFVKWPTDARGIEPGDATLGADVIPDNQNVLQYLQKVEESEQGLFFIDKLGHAVFFQKTHSPSPIVAKFADDGTGIAYQNMQISYGSEDLVNEVVSTSVITSSEITTIDTASQNEYGIFNETHPDLLLSSNSQVIDFNATVLAKYSQPVYRFTSIDININSLDEISAYEVLYAELGSVVQVVFTPSGIPPAINKYAQIIRIAHNVNLSGEHIVTFGLNTLNFTYLILDDPIFGKLDEGSLS